MTKHPSLAFILSFLIVTAAQPDWSVVACILASSVGYALFWKGVVSIQSKKNRFFIATLWFSVIQAVQLSWFTADHYVGGYIYPFLVLLCLFLGLQFGLVTLFIGRGEPMGMVKILGISGAWVLFEWGRLFILSGFSWNVVGFCLSATLWGRQFVSVLGLIGLSLWVFIANLLALKMFFLFSWRRFGAWAMVATVPYLFGLTQILFHSHLLSSDSTPPLRTLLVQTSIYPEQKMPGGLSPLIQWERLLSLLVPYMEKPIDLIVFPEAAIAYATDAPVYHIDSVRHSFQKFFGNSDFLPEVFGKRVGNSYWAQAVANLFAADVVIGLEDIEQESSQAFNAAFLFQPFSSKRWRYEKRVLVPLGEYIPFKWCKAFLSKYGITDSFTRGKEAKVFHTRRVASGVSICYEETYGHLMRENRLKGANLLINISNDVWYPHSRLPLVHFLHGRLRAIEGGAPLVRACNTGVTCGIDSLGRLHGMLKYEKAGRESRAEALYLILPLYHYPTLYVHFGDWPVIAFSLLSVCSMICVQIFSFFRKKRCEDLDVC